MTRGSELNQSCIVCSTGRRLGGNRGVANVDVVGHSCIASAEADGNFRKQDCGRDWMNIHPGNQLRPSTNSIGDFDSAVLLLIDGEWTFIDNAFDALKCLETHFPDIHAPSLVRAIATCDACLTGRLVGDSARAALVVAAMEAGFRFEVISDPIQALERRTELEAEAGLRAILSETK
jgi:hypothetical protein